MAILKSYIIFINKLLFIYLITVQLLSADKYTVQGNIAFNNGHYSDAIKLYLNSKNSKKIQKKIFKSYIKLGDNFLNMRKYKMSLFFYNKAEKYNKINIDDKKSKVYESFGDQFQRVRKYKKALLLYKKALKLKNKNVLKKIKAIQEFYHHQKELIHDRRKIVTSNSPIWTKSIGRLIIPTKRTYITKQRFIVNKKNCSATLVNLKDSTTSNIIITAEHCVNTYHKKAGHIKFIIKTAQNNIIVTNAHILYQSNFDIKKLNTTSDWAILYLDKPISKNDINPLIITDTSYIKLKKNNKYNFASLAGFSSDIAKYGTKLTYDPICHIKKFTKMYGASSCIGFKGSSGGAIILTTSNDNIHFRYHFVGVVSHFRKNKFQNIYFTPHNLFYNQLKSSITFHGNP